MYLYNLEFPNKILLVYITMINVLCRYISLFVIHSSPVTVYIRVSLRFDLNDCHRMLSNVFDRNSWHRFALIHVFTFGRLRRSIVVRTKSVLHSCYFVIFLYSNDSPFRQIAKAIIPPRQWHRSQVTPAFRWCVHMQKGQMINHHLPEYIGVRGHFFYFHIRDVVQRKRANYPAIYFFQSGH